MDQTTLLFVPEDNKMYDVKGMVYFSQYGLDKRQCTVRVTVFAGGSAKIPSLIIFKGKYFADKWRRKKRWDKRVAVVFQMNVWCNKRPWRFGCPSSGVIRTWIHQQTVQVARSSLQISIHKAQHSNFVKIMLKKARNYTY